MPAGYTRKDYKDTIEKRIEWLRKNLKKSALDTFELSMIEKALRDKVDLEYGYASSLDVADGRETSQRYKEVEADREKGLARALQRNKYKDELEYNVKCALSRCLDPTSPIPVQEILREHFVHYHNFVMTEALAKVYDAFGCHDCAGAGKCPTCRHKELRDKILAFRETL